MMFSYSLLKSILTSRIDFGINEKNLLYVIIIFKGTTKYKLLYLKINFNE